MSDGRVLSPMTLMATCPDTGEAVTIPLPEPDSISKQHDGWPLIAVFGPVVVAAKSGYCKISLIPGGRPHWDVPEDVGTLGVMLFAAARWARFTIKNTDDGEVAP